MLEEREEKLLRNTVHPLTASSRWFFSRITPEISIILTVLRIELLTQPVTSTKSHSELHPDGSTVVLRHSRAVVLRTKLKF